MDSNILTKCQTHRPNKGTHNPKLLPLVCLPKGIYFYEYPLPNLGPSLFELLNDLVARYHHLICEEMALNWYCLLLCHKDVGKVGECV